MIVRSFEILAFSGYLFTAPLHAQQWESLGGAVFTLGFVGPVFGDSYSDKLLVGSGAKWLYADGDSLETNGIGIWNGERWDTLPDRLQICFNNGCDAVYSLLRFHDQLYADGAFPFYEPNGNLDSRFARLNNTSLEWEGYTCDAYFMNGIASVAYETTADSLFLVGYYGSLCGLDSSSIYTYDGTNVQRFLPYDDWPNHDDYVGLVFKFLGSWYMTGLFDDLVTQQTYGFLRYTGSAWVPVPGFETAAPIKDILIHNDTLYMCGYFFEGPGIPGNMVAMYDGENWSNLGGGITFDDMGTQLGIVTDLLWWREKLYVSGQFYRAGGVPVEHIAAWNGQRWCGSGADLSPDNAVNSMTTWRDTLYIAGGFNSIDGVPMSRVAKWNGGDFDAVCSPSIGVEEHVLRSVPLSIQPNPTNDFLTLRCANHHQGFLSITDACGRVVLHMSWHDEPIDVRGLSNGVYQLQLRDDEDLPLGSEMFLKY